MVTEKRWSRAGVGRADWMKLREAPERTVNDSLTTNLYAERLSHNNWWEGENEGLVNLRNILTPPLNGAGESQRRPDQELTVEKRQ